MMFFAPFYILYRDANSHHKSIVPKVAYNIFTHKNPVIGNVVLSYAQEEEEGGF